MKIKSERDNLFYMRTWMNEIPPSLGTFLKLMHTNIRFLYIINYIK